MRKFSLLFAIILTSVGVFSQAIMNINEARMLPPGEVVKVRGILTADRATMRWTGYMQDATAGIAFYNSSTAPCAMADSLLPGDIFTITGTLKDYNALLEISPISSITIESRNNPIPAPAMVAVLNISDQFESMLVKLTNVHFDATLQGTIFSGGSSGQNYTVTDEAGISTLIRVLPSTNIPGSLIPLGNVSIIGCLGQYSPTNPNAGYQLLPRNLDDLVSNSSINLTSAVAATEITNSSITLNWQTDNPGSTFVKYGTTPSLELGTLSGSGNTTDHSVTIPGSAAQVLYARAYSISNTVATDTAKSITGVYITASGSTGNIKAYFNTPVDNSVSTGTNAISIGQAVDDTLIAYINRAKQSIDISIYNFNNDGLSNISNALNAAANRGVVVRLIHCGTSASSAVDELVSAVNRLRGPDTLQRDGIMHNKFMIIDAGSANPNDPIVWTGSFNWTDNNMNTDANNVVIIQDQSLAKTFRMEFEEMWGATTPAPNPSGSRFGKFKTNNTPHQLKVGGKWLECYFSPSDNVNVEITNRIKSAETDLEAAVMTFTRKEMSYAIEDAVDAGANASFLTSSFSNLIYTSGTTIDSTIFKVLKNNCHKLGDYTGGGIMHNKYLIVDQGNTASDPLVLTGSHNWTASANNYNDENTIVIHDATLANIYYQNFVKIMSMADILYGIDDITGKPSEKVRIYPNPAQSTLNIDFQSNERSRSTVIIYSLSGRVVKESTHQISQGMNNITLDISGTEPGLYMIKIFNTKSSYSQKLIIQ